MKKIIYATAKTINIAAVTIILRGIIFLFIFAPFHCSQ